MNGEVKEYFIGSISINKVAGTHIYALNIMSALETFFKDLDVPLRNARFASMYSTNVNSGV